MSPHEQEVVVPPVVIDRCTANSMQKALLGSLPVPLRTIVDSALFSCVQLCADSVSANYLVAKLINQELEEIPVLFTRCLQHQAALSISAMTVSLGIVSPLFCAVRVMNSGQHLRRLREAIRAAIDKRFVWERHSAAKAEDQARTRLLLDHCYTGTLACKPCTKDGNIGECPEVRKKESEELCRMFTGNICDRSRIVHNCCPGCCESREQALDRACNALCKPIERRIQTPAANRWLQLTPVISLFLVLGRFHNILAEAELNLVGDSLDHHKALSEQTEMLQEERDDQPDLEARRVGAPESNKAFHIAHARRHRKMINWLASPEEQDNLLIWACIARPTMMIHYHFFKAGSLHGVDSNGYTSMWNCARMVNSTPLFILEQLSRSFSPGSVQTADVWGLATAFKGPFEEWQPSFLARSMWCCRRVMGNIWRRVHSSLAWLALALSPCGR